MGLLEQLLARMDALNTRLDVLENGQPVSVTVENKVEGTTTTVEQTEAGVTVNTVELDKNGIPWDERIHAGTKRKNADGTWSLKKGVDKELAAQIIAEYQSTAPATTTVQAAPAKPGVPTPPAPPAAPAKPGVPAAPVPPAPPKAEEAGPTVKAARLSNVLINDMGVDYRVRIVTGKQIGRAHV